LSSALSFFFAVFEDGSGCPDAKELTNHRKIENIRYHLERTRNRILMKLLTDKLFVSAVLQKVHYGFYVKTGLSGVPVWSFIVTAGGSDAQN